LLNNEILHKVIRPARYTGGEWNSIVKDWDTTPIRFAIAFPDTYEVGMSNLAVQILYEILNGQPDTLAARAFAPWVDMEAALRENKVPLASLENDRSLKDFDIVGFSLGYELSYTNVLNMLDLAGIPVLASERTDEHPLVIAGGSSTLNPEPMADFIDAFVVGDGEDVVLELLDVYRRYGHRKYKGAGKEKLLRQLAKVPGVYVPGLYQVEYGQDGLIKSFKPVVPEAPAKVQRRIVTKLPPPPVKSIVPYIEVIHDRGVVEVQRGCSRGCRFCQAGMVYRPVRERSHEEIISATAEIIANCGYDEISLLSLNTTDFSGVDTLVADMAARFPGLTISLPSLRLDNFSINLVGSLPTKNRTGLTFAPEAGSERLRRAINKNITDQSLLETAGAAFKRGWTSFKLYFMVGLPTETNEDVQGIVTLVDKVREEGRKASGRKPMIRISVSTFVPKPHTPFQWCKQEDEASLRAKQEILQNGLQSKGVRLSWHDPNVSLLESSISRGDRRTGKVIKRAWELGCRFDAWTELYFHDKWMQAFKDNDIDPAFYATRERSLDEILPWSFIDTGVSEAFLKREYLKAQTGQDTSDCRTSACNACGLEKTEICTTKLVK
jgi:radical SAM family uncharacterized protein